MALPTGELEATSYPTFIREVGALAMGSSTYEWMLRHVVGPEARRPQAWPYKQPAWVFTSRTLPAIPGADIRFVRGDVRPVHAGHGRGGRLARTSGSLEAGSWRASSMITGLLDELFVQVGSRHAGGWQAASAAGHHQSAAASDLGEGGRPWFRRNCITRSRVILGRAHPEDQASH